MQPLLIPDVPALMAYGFLFAFAGMFALLLVARMEQHRFLAALVIVLVCLGGTLYASQPVTSPCGVCRNIESGSWAYYWYGCWACG